MRWPWRSRGAEPDPVERAGTGSPAPAGAGPADGWRTLAPLQRTTHHAESACHLDTFPTTLATRQDPRFLEPLGHYVEPTAPAGSVEGLAQPAGRAATEFALPPRPAPTGVAAPGSPVQRSAASVSPPAAPSTPPAPAPADTPAAPSPEQPTVAPTIGVDQQPSEVEPDPAPAAVEPPTPLQRAVAPAAGLDVVRPSPASDAPIGTPVVARTAAAGTTAEKPTPIGGPAALPAVTPRPVPAFPLPVVARSVAEPGADVTPDPADSSPAQGPLVIESTDVPAEPGTLPAVDLLGERPIRVEGTPASAPLPPAPIPAAAAPAVQRVASRPEEPPSRSPAPAQRTEVSAVPLPLAPPALAWPPPPAEKPTPVRPVPTPGLTVQALAADLAPGPSQTTRTAQSVQPVQRVVAEPLSSTAGAGLPEPAVLPTAFVPERADPAPRPAPVAAVSRVTTPIPVAPAGPATQLQRSAVTMPPAPASTPVAVGSRPLAPDSPSAPTYESMPASIRSMPLQRLFSAATPQTTRRELPTRPSGPAPGQAGQVDPHPVPDGGSTEVAIRWEQPQATVQRAEEGGGETATAPAPEAPSAAGVATALGSTSPAPAKPGGTDLDELARRLYAPMSALLRAELWLDRERSGRSLTR